MSWLTLYPLVSVPFDTSAFMAWPRANSDAAVIDQAAVNGDGLSYTVQDCIDLADQKGTTQALLNGMF